VQKRRVVITGMGAVSPFGTGARVLAGSILDGRSGVRRVPELELYEGLGSLVAAPVEGIDPKIISRKHRRTMSPMSVYAALAAEEALLQARLDETRRKGGDMGVAIGSSVGSTISTQQSYSDFFNFNSLEKMRSTGFFKIMNHSCAANVCHALGITGRVLAASSACSTSCQTIGYGAEMVAFGTQEIMVCGGAEEYHPLITATFDIMNASSRSFNRRPESTPRPFDRDRDGVVCGDGCGIVVLESLDSARRRGVPALAEVTGFASVCDTTNMVNPSKDFMELCMRKALEDAGVAPEEIDYVNAHATGTDQGDRAESEAVARVFGSGTAVSSLKGHMGHTMAASGALEIVAVIELMDRGFVPPTLNLENIDPDCAGVRHVTSLESKEIKCVLKNGFAFGGVNSSIVIRRIENE
jgi:3-oxoacyl-[acyl-carrier-protein] synthase II